jgi:hypothetical protein
MAAMLHTRNNPGFFKGTLSSKRLPMSGGLEIASE